MFAPPDGLCTHCGRQIYNPDAGYGLDEAASRVITSCPYCHATYID